MAPTPSGGDFSTPKKPATSLLGCQRKGCPGVCPTKVVVAKARTDKPARCRVCERKFTVPPGSDKSVPAKQTTTKGEQAKPGTDEVKKLRQELALKDKRMAELEAHQSANVDEGGGEAVSSEKNPKQRLFELENLLKGAKDNGLFEIAKDLEKKVSDLRETIEAGKAGGDPCTAILRKLKAAQNRQAQLREQIQKDFDRLD